MNFRIIPDHGLLCESAGRSGSNDVWRGTLNPALFLNRLSVFFLLLACCGCVAVSHPASTGPDPSLDYIGSGESSTFGRSFEKAQKIARKEAIVSLVTVVSSDVIDVHSRFLGLNGKTSSASASVLVSKLNLSGKVRFYETRPPGKVRILAYLPKADILNGVSSRNRPAQTPSGMLSSGQVIPVTGTGFASLSDYGFLDAREIAMRRAMKDALMKGRMLYQGDVIAQNVQMGSIHERSLFLQNSFDILGMKLSVLPEIEKSIEGIHVRLLAVRVSLTLRRKSLDGPVFQVRLDHPFYQDGESAHLSFSVNEPLYIAVFDRYGFSGSVVGIIPTAEHLPENVHYRSTREQFFATSPGEFLYPPDDPTVSLVASLPSGVTKVSEEYLVIFASKKPFPFHPRYDQGSAYFELDRKVFRTFLRKMLERPLSEWSMKTIPFIVYGKGEND